MDKWKCYRCGYRSRRRTDFIRHLRRKYPCPPKLSEISVEGVFRGYFPSGGGLNFPSNPTIPPKTSQNLPKTPKTSQYLPKRNTLKSNEEPGKRGPVRQFACSYCETEFSRGDSLKRHEDKVCKSTEALEARLVRKELQLRLREVESPRQVQIFVSPPASRRKSSLPVPNGA